MQELRHWLVALGIEQCADMLIEEEFTWETITELDEDDMKKLGIKMGPRKVLQGGIAKLLAERSPSIPHQAMQHK